MYLGKSLVQSGQQALNVNDHITAYLKIKADVPTV